MTVASGDDALEQIRDALHSSFCSLALVFALRVNGGSGMGVQVMVKTRKIGPVIFPAPDQTLADVLHMLGEMAETPPVPGGYGSSSFLDTDTDA